MTETAVSCVNHSFVFRGHCHPPPPQEESEADSRRLAGGNFLRRQLERRRRYGSVCANSDEGRFTSTYSVTLQLGPGVKRLSAPVLRRLPIFARHVLRVFMCRVCLEIGLQFSLYDTICRYTDKALG